MPEGERDSEWRWKNESWKAEVGKIGKQQRTESLQQRTTKAPSESFTDWNKFKNSEQYKKLSWRLREHIHICVWCIPDSNFRKNFISALSQYINKYNTIDIHKVNEILQKEHYKFRRDLEIKNSKKIAGTIHYIGDGIKKWFDWSKNLFSNLRNNEHWNLQQDTETTQWKDILDNGINYKTSNNGLDDNKKSDNNNSSKKDETNIDLSAPSQTTAEQSLLEHSDPSDNLDTDLMTQLKWVDKEDIIELIEWSNDGPKTVWSYTPLKILFIKEKWYNVKNGKIPNIDKDFQVWNDKRIDDIKYILNPNFLVYFADGEQTLTDSNVAGNKSVEGNQIETWEPDSVSYNLKGFDEAFEKLSRYTKGEIIWELLASNNIKDEDKLYYLQLIITAFLKKENLYEDSFITWKWNTKTQLFLQKKILNDPDFKKEPNYEKYKTAIEKILANHDDLDISWEDDVFMSFSESVRRDEEYWNDPEAFWRKQSIEWQREFVWITDAVHRTSYEQWQKSFIENNMKGFNKKIEYFLSLPKLQDWETPNAETKTKMDQIWNAIPIEQLNSIYEQFASNPEEQKKFEEFLKNNNLPNTDLQDASLKNFVIKKNLSNPAAEYCYQRLWTCLQEQITWEAGKTLQYLSDKTWDTAFNIKNKVLEFFLPGISIHPENSENWIFYFRDENNLDTLYWFDPENWKIFQKGNISLWEDGIIKFWASEAEWNLLKQIHGFQDMISFELWDILPNKNADSVDELEKQITKKIESKINVESVVDTSVVSQALLKKENEKNVCRDRIVWDIKYLLDIERSELHSGDWEKYKIFRSLVKTFDKIKVESPNDNTPLVTMKDFLDKVYSSASQWSLLKPSDSWENMEERDNDNLSQEGENWSIENQPQEMWKLILLKNLINPQTQLFDINLITTLNQDKEIHDFLAKRDFNNVIWKISKRKDLQELDKDTDNQISQLTEKTWEELRWLYEETQLLASINALEKQGDFLS